MHIINKTLEDLSGVELCVAWLSEIERLYGTQCAEASHATYGRGWYYIEIAMKYGPDSYGVLGPHRYAYRKTKVIEMIETLRRREPTPDDKED